MKNRQRCFFRRSFFAYTVFLCFFCVFCFVFIPLYAEESALSAPPDGAAVYAENGSLYLGNPSAAEDNPDTHADNFLMIKNGYALSYNNGKKIPNWVSWHLDDSDLGDIKRKNDFRADSALPEGWYAVKGGREKASGKAAAESDYRFSVYGFDRGHLCPSGDRTKSEAVNSETFLMTNMIPQTPKNNRHTWRLLEETARQFANNGYELYIICGPAGKGGTSQKGFFESIPVGDGGLSIEVPAYTWKVLIVLEKGENDLARIDGKSLIIAVSIPNTEDCNRPWHEYALSVDELEKVTGYDFFSELSDTIEEVLENKKYEYRQAE